MPRKISLPKSTSASPSKYFGKLEATRSTTASRNKSKGKDKAVPSSDSHESKSKSKSIKRKREEEEADADETKDVKLEEMDVKQEYMDVKQEETDVKQEEMNLKQEEMNVKLKQEEKDVKQEEKDNELEEEEKEEEEEEEEEEEKDRYTEEWDSDALDDGPKKVKRKTTTTGRTRKASLRNGNGKAKKGEEEEEGSPRKKRRKKNTEVDGEQVDSGDDELKEGQTVAGRIVQPPKEGWAPPGQISQHTLDFLKNLAIPEHNDRAWFKLHEPVYRLVEKEWKQFVETFTPHLMEVDPHIPELPPKDLIYRIYRDVRFRADKTPYKQGVSASFSRSGRKGIFAGFIPNNRSLVAAGLWQPEKNELSTFRHNIMRDSSRSRFKEVISSPEFRAHFGDPERPREERQNVFARSEDALKKLPRGFITSDPDAMEFLKLRTIVVHHTLLDSQVAAPDFIDTVCKVVKVMRPFVHCLNDLITIPPDDDEDSSDEDAEDEE